MLLLRLLHSALDFTRFTLVWLMLLCAQVLTANFLHSPELKQQTPFGQVPVLQVDSQMTAQSAAIGAPYAPLIMVVACSPGCLVARCMKLRCCIAYQKREAVLQQVPLLVCRRQQAKCCRFFCIRLLRARQWVSQLLSYYPWFG